MVPARTAVPAGSAEVLAKRAGARLRMAPASRAIRGGVRPRRAPVVRPRPMVRAGARRGTRAADMVRRLRRVRGRTAAGGHARPAATGHAGTLAPLPAANPETAGRPRAASTEPAGPPRAANIGAAAMLRAEHLGAARAREAADPEAVRPPAASRAWAEVRRAAITAAAPGLRTPDHDGPPRVTQGGARDLRGKGRRRAVTAVTRRRGRPAAGVATAVRVTLVEATTG